MTTVLALLLAAASPSPDFTVLLRTLVETDTTLATGSCTAAANAAADAMRRGGVPDKAIVPFSKPGHPREGGLLGYIDGSERGLKPVLLIAHIDTVPADPVEWTHPPFSLTESGGYFYGRGVADNKAAAALLVELMIALHRAEAPQRGVAIGLTCGEETPTAFNGAHWLATEGRTLIDPSLVLVVSGGASLDARGKPSAFTIAVAEKTQQNFRIEARGLASHASQADPDNAIVSLAKATVRLAGHAFPIELSEANRAQLDRATRTAAPAEAAAIQTLLSNPSDTIAQAHVEAKPAWNGLLRTTCVTTILETGRQANTVSGFASANVNCRLLPRTSVAAVQRELERILEGLPVTVRPAPPLAKPTAVPPRPDALLAAAQAAADSLWPGAEAAPAMLTGATDARHFNAAGIPAYGAAVLPYEADGSRVHATDERVRIQSVNDGRAFIQRLVERLSR